MHSDSLDSPAVLADIGRWQGTWTVIAVALLAMPFLIVIVLGVLGLSPNDRKLGWLYAVLVVVALLACLIGAIPRMHAP